VMGRADGAMRLETCGGIRRQRARPHGRPFHGGDAGVIDKKRKRGKRRRKKEMRWRSDEWGPLVGDSCAG
jgi:hypothetical protein